MKRTLLQLYDKLILEHPLSTLIITILVVSFFAFHIPDFKLDASGDSLVLENDEDLRYHRRISQRYDTNEVLVLTFTPQGDLFEKKSLDTLKALRSDLRRLDGIASVTTILDVPLLLTTDVSLSDLADADEVKTLEDTDIPPAQAAKEFWNNPLYKNRLLSEDGKTTAILMELPENEKYMSLLRKRYQLREKEYSGTITPAEGKELEQISRRYRQELTRVLQAERKLVKNIRRVMAEYDDAAQLYLGGVPMIVADMIAFIKKDLIIFGGGVCLFLIIALVVIFRQTRWVMLAMFCCGLAVLTMLGYLGLVDWRVTVISSNFISLMLILTMSLTIHLIERYIEVRVENPEQDRRSLVRETVRTIALPCFYTTITTMVAFSSLLVSNIRPVIDFGNMMTIGLVVAFVLAFVLFPATVLLFGRDEAGRAEDFSHPVTLVFSRFTHNHGRKVLLISILLAIASGVGMSRLQVENKFIDYFRKDTEIYKGMSLIDRKLGGTTPLSLIIDFKSREQPVEDPFAEDDISIEEEFQIETVSYWYADVITMERIEKVHDYLASLEQTGEVLSLGTAWKISTMLNENEPLDNYELALLVKKSPPELKKILIDPYVSTDPDQARFTTRVIETGHRIQRTALLDKIRTHLTEKLDFDSSQIHFTDMFVLYNNMLRSLFRSQILTIGMVFLGIFVMFLILFRSLNLALIAVVPNILPVAMVLGAMGWFDIPLDMMTITIASITIGIAVDDTIHYIHRFQKEFRQDGDYRATVTRCHRSIGRALYYTTVTIAFGFSVLVFSSFIPTIYFGLFTCFAMLVALLADLTLLPELFILFKPLGPETINKKK